MSDETKPQDSAAMPPASAGSQPVAWAAVFDGEVDAEFVWPFMADANAWAAARPGVEIVPLYRQPQPTLTDEEREAIRWVVGEALSVDGVSIQPTLRSLLARTDRTKKDTRDGGSDV